MRNNKSIDKIKLNRPCTPIIRRFHRISFEEHFLPHCNGIDEYEDIIDAILNATIGKNKSINSDGKKRASLGTLYCCLLCGDFVSSTTFASHIKSRKVKEQHKDVSTIVKIDMEVNEIRRIIKGIEKLFFFVYAEDRLDPNLLCIGGNHDDIERIDEQPNVKISNRNSKGSNRNSKKSNSNSKGSNKRVPKGSDGIEIIDEQPNVKRSGRNSKGSNRNPKKSNRNPKGSNKHLSKGSDDNISKGPTTGSNIDINGSNNLNNNNGDGLVVDNNTNRGYISITSDNQFYYNSNSDTSLFKVGTGCNGFEDRSIDNLDTGDNDDDDNGTNNIDTYITRIYDHSYLHDSLDLTNYIEPNCVPISGIEKGDNDTLPDYDSKPEMKCDPNNINTIVERYEAPPPETKQGKGIKPEMEHEFEYKFHNITTIVEHYEEATPSPPPLPPPETKQDKVIKPEVKCEFEHKFKNITTIVEYYEEPTPSPPLETKRKGNKRKERDDGDDNQN